MERVEYPQQVPIYGGRGWSRYLMSAASVCMLVFLNS